MQNHALFPTLVCQFSYDYPQKFKKTVKDTIFDHLDPNGYSEERTGHVNIHHEPAYEDMYKFAVACAKHYVEQYNVDPNQFDFNVVKSWFNITEESPNPVHSHADANIAFIYYVQIPDNCRNALRFYNYIDRHEPYPRFCSVNEDGKGWNLWNSLTWQFMPIEGELFVFAGNLSHDTVGNSVGPNSGVKNDNLANKRIAIAGDILLTFKQPSPKPMGIQPISNWKLFE